MQNAYLRSMLQSEKPKTILRYERTLNGMLPNGWLPMRNANLRTPNDLRMPNERLR